MPARLLTQTEIQLMMGTNAAERTLASFLPVLQTVFVEMRLETGVLSHRRFLLENVEIHLKDDAEFAKTRHHYNTWTLIVEMD
ncbi:uncharacterized protein LOC128224083 isoform X5 [Mya arenaria]|uniref:uncharacterized protein LOC128224083 isoform X5 n=1 Tax=Mya arenaria TaxID=6604 RepID=UPI0022E102C2|nr:uncharacterized protein LOC128224083 isoform X5 [Mya arenaria]